MNYNEWIIGESVVLNPSWSADFELSVSEAVVSLVHCRCFQGHWRLYYSSQEHQLHLQEQILRFSVITLFVLPFLW